MKKNFKQIIIVCPGGGTTGGVELLHQLAHTLQQNKVLTKILYYPFNKKNDVPAPYLKYSTNQTTYDEAIKSEGLFIIPETYTHLVDKFGCQRSIIWWMSVDNYLASGRLIYSIKTRLNPFAYQDIKKKNQINEVVANLVQSNYAREFLQSHGVHNILNLGDYINDDFMAARSNVNKNLKKDIILYNPAKGFAVTKKLIQISGEKFIPISGLPREEVIKLMLQSKLYVDFGNHPGKDRIPREAAILGCVILTNVKGSAANYKDVPIPICYKFDDSLDIFYSGIISVIDEIFNNFDLHYSRFEDYRELIGNEKQIFCSDVVKLIEYLGIVRRS